VSVAAARLSIGAVARLTDTPITTLRFYERRGLLDPPPRSGGQRRYEPAVLMRLMVIRFCRVAGLSIDDIAAVVADASPGRSATRAIARRQLDRIDAQLEQLALARRMMDAVLACSCATIERCECGAMDGVTAELRAIQNLTNTPSAK
jgi:DNA-binding transcriptional MerR regulator